MKLNITVVGGAGSIGLVHSWVLAAAGHHVTILDARPDGAPGDSYKQLIEAHHFSFHFPEIDRIIESLLEGGESSENFRMRFNHFPSIFIKKINELIPQNSDAWLSRETCLQIINQTIQLPANSIQLAQSSHKIAEKQDLIVVPVKCAALTGTLAEKINRIRQNHTTPVVTWVNGIQPGLYLDRLSSISDFVNCIGREKIKAGVLIKYGAAIDGIGAVRVRSDFLKITNIIANITNTHITPDLRMISDAYTNAGINTKPTQEIKSIILEKLSYNLTGSIMGAIFGYTMGGLIDNPSTRQAVEDCAAEFYRLALQLGVELAGSESAFIEKAIDALNANASVISSPLQDIRQGRPTEKDYLVKTTIKLAQENGMDLPVLQAMYDLITLVEEQSLADVNEVSTLQENLLTKLRIQKGNIVRTAKYILDSEKTVNKLLCSSLGTFITESAAPLISSNAVNEDEPNHLAFK